MCKQTKEIYMPDCFKDNMQIGVKKTIKQIRGIIDNIYILADQKTFTKGDFKRIKMKLRYLENKFKEMR